MSNQQALRVKSEMVEEVQDGYNISYNNKNIGYLKYSLPFQKMINYQTNINLKADIELLTQS